MHHVTMTMMMAMGVRKVSPAKMVTSVPMPVPATRASSCHSNEADRSGPNDDSTSLYRLTVSEEDKSAANPK